MTSERGGARTSRRALAAALALAAIGGAWAQTPPPPRIALISLIGDSLTLETYRGRTGTTMQGNVRSFHPMPAPTFDVQALTQTQRLVEKMYPSAELVMLAVPKAGSDSDPVRLLDGGKPVADNPVWKAMQGRFSHAIVIGKARILTSVRFYDTRADAGALSGLGFFLDYDLSTGKVGEAAVSQGYIAPYANLRLSLVDVGSLTLISERLVNEAVPQSAVVNKEGFDPWGALSAEQKVDYISELIRRGLDKAVPALFTPGK